MVSLKNLTTLAILIGGAAAFVGLGGASGIGSRIGGGFSSFGTALIDSFTNNLTPQNNANQQNTAQGIVQDLDLDQQVTDVPMGDKPITPREKGLLTLAGFLQDQRIPGNINLKTGIFTSPVTRQPLDFAIAPSGDVRTGRIGLADQTLAAQARLSKQFGIPTFDIKGNISTFGGLVTER